jgi:hypothetical protein
MGSIESMHKRPRCEVVRNTTHRSAEALPCFAITREQYIRYGGMPTRLAGEPKALAYLWAREDLLERGIDPNLEENEELLQEVEACYDGSEEDNPLLVIDFYFGEDVVQSPNIDKK